MPRFRARAGSARRSGPAFRAAAALAGLWASGPAGALACPTAADLATGVVFTTTDARTRVTARRIDGSTIRVDMAGEGGPQTSLVYRDGLFPVASAHPNGLTIFGYDPPSPVLRLEDGEHLAFTVVARTPGRAEEPIRAEISVHGTEEVSIGGCTYQGRVIERINTHPDGHSDFVLFVFSPELAWVLQSRIRFDDGRVQNTSYGSVAPAAGQR